MISAKMEGNSWFGAISSLVNFEHTGALITFKDFVIFRRSWDGKVDRARLNAFLVHASNLVDQTFRYTQTKIILKTLLDR